MSDPNASVSEELTASEWFRRLIIDWELSERQLADLLGVDEARVALELNKTRAEALAGPTVPLGIESAPALIRIYQLLAAAHPKLEDQVKWLFTANQDFGGEKPIDVVASSRENLFWVSYYLESARAAKSLKDQSTKES